MHGGDVFDLPPPKVKLPILLSPGGFMEIPSMVSMLIVNRRVAIKDGSSNTLQPLEPGTHHLQVWGGVAIGEDNKPMTWQQIGAWSEPVAFETNYAERICACKSSE